MFDVRTGIMKRAGLFGNPLQQQPKPPAPEPEKRDTGHRVAGYLADALAGLAGQQGPYGAMLADERAQREQEAQYQRQRADQFADWRQRQEYERANPDQSSLQYFDDNAGNRYSYNPATGEQSLIFTDPNDKMFLQDGQLVTVPNTVRLGQTGGEQRQTIGGKTYVKRGDDWFEEGGPAPQAPAGFRQ